MNNQILNALVALIEDRPRDAREMLRAPGVKTPGDIFQRIGEALQKREDRARVATLKDVLRTSLRIDADRRTGTPESREAFLSGVAEVEQIVENLIEELEPGT